MKLYKLLHIPTGLYLGPAKWMKSLINDDDFVRSNLSKQGKVYQTKPTATQINSWFCGDEAIYSHLVKGRKKIPVYMNDIKLIVFEVSSSANSSYYWKPFKYQTLEGSHTDYAFRVFEGQEYYVKLPEFKK